MGGGGSVGGAPPSISVCAATLLVLGDGNVGRDVEAGR